MAGPAGFAQRVIPQGFVCCRLDANRAGTLRCESGEAPVSPARISWILVFIDTSPKNLLTPGRPKRVGRPPTHANSNPGASSDELEERIRQPERKMLERNSSISSVNRKSQRIYQWTTRNGYSSSWNCRYAGFQPIQ